MVKSAYDGLRLPKSMESSCAAARQLQSDRKRSKYNRILEAFIDTLHGRCSRRMRFQPSGRVAYQPMQGVTHSLLEALAKLEVSFATMVHSAHSAETAVNL